LRFHLRTTAAALKTSGTSESSCQRLSCWAPFPTTADLARVLFGSWSKSRSGADLPVVLGELHAIKGAGFMHQPRILRLRRRSAATWVPAVTAWWSRQQFQESAIQSVNGKPNIIRADILVVGCFRIIAHLTTLTRRFVVLQVVQ